MFRKYDYSRGSNTEHVFEWHYIFEWQTRGLLARHFNVKRKLCLLINRSRLKLKLLPDICRFSLFQWWRGPTGHCQRSRTGFSGSDRSGWSSCSSRSVNILVLETLPKYRTVKWVHWKKSSWPKRKIFNSCLVPIPRKLDNSWMAADLPHLLSVDAKSTNMRKL